MNCWCIAARRRDEGVLVGVLKVVVSGWGDSIVLVFLSVFLSVCVFGCLCFCTFWLGVGLREVDWWMDESWQVVGCFCRRGERWLEEERRRRSEREMAGIAYRRVSIGMSRRVPLTGPQ